MKSTIALATVAALFSVGATAQTTFAQLDLDGSGGLSFPEIVVVLPDLTEDEFNTADANSDTELSPEEVSALVSARQ